MISTLHYFRNAAATISFAPAGGYIRLDWQGVPATVPELRAIYEHVLRALLHHCATSLMTVHNQRPPMPPEIQTWLTQDWMPRAVAEVGYGRCAIVEATTPLGRLAARSVGAGVNGQLCYQYFDSEASADAWLQEP